MKSYELARIGQHRGRPRLWLQGRKVAHAGFLPGRRFCIRKDATRHMIVLELDEAGPRLVSSKLQGARQTPVIDINSAPDLAVLDGFTAVRIIVQLLRIVILPSTVELARKERLQRLRAKVATGAAILMGSVSHGGGILSHALHAGLQAAGLKPRLAFANEIRPELLEHAAACNDAWDDQTIALAAPLQELAYDAWATGKLPKVEILEGGLPCSGASISGRSRRGLGHAEEHPEVGHLVVPFIALIAKVQPAVIVLENVRQYLATASMSILRNHLRDFGYQVHETVLQAADWNVLERRERMCMVALTEGMAFSFDELQRPRPAPRRIADVLEPIADDAPCWSAMAGLKAKEDRDRASGKGFAMQVITAASTSCPTITKGYAKVRSTDPKLAHPCNPQLLRQFTVIEHARIKGIPEHLAAGLSQTVGHEVLGQSICYAPFEAVGRLIGRTLTALAAGDAAQPVCAGVEEAAEPALA